MLLKDLEDKLITDLFLSIQGVLVGETEDCFACKSLSNLRRCRSLVLLKTRSVLQLIFSNISLDERADVIFMPFPVPILWIRARKCWLAWAPFTGPNENNWVWRKMAMSLCLLPFYSNMHFQQTVRHIIWPSKGEGTENANNKTKNINSCIVKKCGRPWGGGGKKKHVLIPCWTATNDSYRNVLIIWRMLYRRGGLSQHITCSPRPGALGILY